MNILSVGYPLFPVSSDAGGGAEQILSLLERGLVDAGHHSIVVAAQGSRVSGQLIKTSAANGQITDEIRRRAQEEHRHGICEVLREHKIDLVHFHGLDFYDYVPEQQVPKLATLHLPVAWYPQTIFAIPGVRVNYVSQSQATGLAGPVVCNGVDTERYQGSYEKQGFLLTLGRICPEKGMDAALRVAHRLDLPMIVAGPVHAFESHQRYFREQVKPLLDEKRRYIGPVGLRDKPELLGAARCLLIASSVSETSSLVAMEAMSAGTPVVALRSGALPEVIEEGVTGFIVDSEEEMTVAAKQVDEISPQVCRARARTRFSSERMVADYLKLYRELVSGDSSQ